MAARDFEDWRECMDMGLQSFSLDNPEDFGDERASTTLMDLDSGSIDNNSSQTQLGPYSSLATPVPNNYPINNDPMNSPISYFTIDGALADQLLSVQPGVEQMGMKQTENQTFVPLDNTNQISGNKITNTCQSTDINPDPFPDLLTSELTTAVMVDQPIIGQQISFQPVPLSTPNSNVTIQNVLTEAGAQQLQYANAALPFSKNVNLISLQPVTTVQSSSGDGKVVPEPKVQNEETPVTTKGQQIKSGVRGFAKTVKRCANAPVPMESSRSKIPKTATLNRQPVSNSQPQEYTSRCKRKISSENIDTTGSSKSVKRKPSVESLVDEKIAGFANVKDKSNKDVVQKHLYLYNQLVGSENVGPKGINESNSNPQLWTQLPMPTAQSKKSGQATPNAPSGQSPTPKGNNDQQTPKRKPASSTTSTSNKFGTAEVYQIYSQLVHPNKWFPGSVYKHFIFLMHKEMKALHGFVATQQKKIFDLTHHNERLKVQLDMNEETKKKETQKGHEVARVKLKCFVDCKGRILHDQPHSVDQTISVDNIMKRLVEISKPSNTAKSG